MVPALKSASGLLPSAEENCFMRSSRDFASTSPTVSRRRFCTDVALPSPNRLLELLRELAVVLPEDGRELVLERLVDRAGLLGELVL